MKTWNVRIQKPDRTKEQQIDFFVSAKDARSAFEKIDAYTGTYDTSFIMVQQVDAKIYPEKVDEHLGN